MIFLDGKGAMGHMTSYIILGCLALFLVFILTRFRPAATQMITDNLYAIRCGMVNFYAVKTSVGVVLFDTGISPILARHGLHKLGIAPSSVTHVFLTHTDFDHTGGLAAFPQAKCYLSAAEEQMINGETARRGFLRNGRLSSYRTLEDGETVVVGSTTIEMSLASGHTPGSAVYKIDERILVVGDLLRLSKEGAILPFLRLMNMSHRQNIQSVEAMRPVIEKTEYILSGHSGLYRPGA